MDDLLALMEGGDEAEEAEISTQPPSLSPSHSNNNLPRVSPPSATQQPTSKKLKKRTSTGEAQVDSQLNIRMTERKIGSLDLLEMIQERNYHSPAALAAMSLATLNQQLVDPSPVVGMATVCGNTNLLTIGIVFSNSGSKIAAKGNAFAVLTIGSNIQTGPSVSVLLFGPAYSKYCRDIKPGHVVALENPRLIPPKPDADNQNSKFHDTAISFTVNDERRLLLVAKAKDFGICPAMIRGKNAQGQWVSNAKRCQAAIDTRAGKYCQLHRKFECVQIGPTSSGNKPSNNNKKGTFIQQERAKLNIAPLRREGQPLLLPNNKNAVMTSNTRLSGVPHQMSRVQQTMQGQQLPRNNDALRRDTPIVLKGNRSNKLLNPSRETRSQIQPKASSLHRPSRPTDTRLTTTALLNPSNHNKKAIDSRNQQKIRQRSANPYSKPKNSANVSVPSKQTTTDRNTTKKPNATQNWLPISGTKGRKTSPSLNKNVATSMKKSKTKLNTAAMGGFDGQVAVPKPSKMFATSGTSVFNSLSVSTHQNAGPSREDILAKQSHLAIQRKASQGSKKAKQTSCTISYRTKTTAVHGNNNSSGFFGSALVQSNGTVQNLDHEAILNAKSLFATEADAEAYAASRRRLTELEQEEARREASAARKGKNNNQETATGKKVLDKEWICRTCCKHFKKEPHMCKQANHVVVCKRVLNKSDETIADKRMKLTSKTSQDGGLLLGAGLNWTQFKSSRFS